MDEKLLRIAQALLGQSAGGPPRAPFSGQPYTGFDRGQMPRGYADQVISASGNSGGAPSTEPLPGRYPGLPMTWTPVVSGYGGPHDMGSSGPMALPSWYMPGQQQRVPMPPQQNLGPMPAQNAPAAPSGLLPAMQPGTQIGDNAAYSGVRANWRPEDQAALEAILEEQKRQMAVQNQSPNQWVNPWQAP